MYRRLAPLIGKFISIETITGPFGCTYTGKLVDVNPETFAIKSFGEDGSPKNLWIGLVPNIVSVQIDGLNLQELACEAKYHQAKEEFEANGKP